MQGHFCFIKCLIFEQLPEVDVSAICRIFDKACSCGPYQHTSVTSRFKSIVRSEVKKRWNSGLDKILQSCFFFESKQGLEMKAIYDLNLKL